MDMDNMDIKHHMQIITNKLANTILLLKISKESVLIIQIDKIILMDMGMIHTVLMILIMVIMENTAIHTITRKREENMIID